MRAPGRVDSKLLMENGKLHILLVDDEPAHTELIRRTFLSRQESVRLTVVQNLQEAEAVIAQSPPDLFIIDLLLPDGSGIDFLNRTDNATRFPVILMTSHGNEHVAVEAIKAGAVDYVVKSTATLLDMPRIADRALREWSHIVERRQTERALAESEQRFRGVIEQSADGIMLADENGVIVEWNQAAEQICGLPRHEAVGQMLWDTYYHYFDYGITYDVLKQALMNFLESGSAPWLNELHERTLRRDDGTTRIVQILMFPIKMESRQMLGSVFRDVTDSRRTEELLHQQDRLAAVGQLAAGIAHDFNNIMAVILLYAQTPLLTMDLPPRLRDNLTTIVLQAKRAAELIEQILDFSRRTVLEPQPLVLVPLLKEQVKLLQRTLPEDIVVSLASDNNDCVVMGDPARIQQAVMNLALNARDAMANGGRLTIRIAGLQLPAGAPLPLPTMSAGDWVVLSVEDTGVGIDDEALPHLFEPFFTTKSPGRGAGLGLAQVYGIVQQHNGHIHVATKLASGTTVTIYFPAYSRSDADDFPVESVTVVRGHEETILVVEDNELAREALVSSLERLNYRVLAAQNGREALQLFAQHRLEVQLVLSDVVMPDMDGLALLRALRQQTTSVPVLMLTGHPLEDRLETLRQAGMSDWLLKPVGLPQLAQMISQLLLRAA